MAYSIGEFEEREWKGPQNKFQQFQTVIGAIDGTILKLLYHKNEQQKVKCWIQNCVKYVNSHKIINNINKVVSDAVYKNIVFMPLSTTAGPLSLLFTMIGGSTNPMATPNCQQENKTNQTKNIHFTDYNSIIQSVYCVFYYICVFVSLLHLCLLLHFTIFRSVHLAVILLTAQCSF